MASAWRALSALVFLYRRYRDVLSRELGSLDGLTLVRHPERLPVVLTRAEVQSVLAQLAGAPHLVASLLYGSGLRLLEALAFRVKDLDFARHELIVRRGKGQKDRLTMLPASLTDPLTAQLARVVELHQRDLARGAGRVMLPEALGRKYPSAAGEWRWQFVFPARRLYTHTGTGERGRYHLHESVVQRAVRQAVGRAGITKRATCHAFRPRIGSEPRAA